MFQQMQPIDSLRSGHRGAQGHVISCMMIHVSVAYRIRSVHACKNVFNLSICLYIIPYIQNIKKFAQKIFPCTFSHTPNPPLISHSLIPVV